MKGKFKKVFAVMLSMALAFGPGAAALGPEAVMASDTDDITDTGVSIPLNQKVNLNVAKRDHVYEEYDAFYFTTGSDRAYYTFVWEGSNAKSKPEIYITPVLSKDYSKAVMHAFIVPDYKEIGSVSGGGTALSPNTNYYILLQHGGDSSYDATVSINCYKDAESDGASGAAVLSEGKTQSALIDGKGDVDVFCFETGNATYTLNTEQESGIGYKIYSDSSLTKQVFSDTAYSGKKSFDLSSKLSVNTKYYIKTERTANVSKEPVKYSLTFVKKGDASTSNTGSSTDGKVEAELKLLENTKITVKKGETSGLYAVYSFKTSVVKAYYNVLWSSSDNSKVSYDLLKTPEYSSVSLVDMGTLGSFTEIGSVLGLGKKLEPSTTYYLRLKRDTSKDYSGNITIKYVMDEEADTAELAEPVIPGSVRYGSIDSSKDVDVFYLDTENSTFYMNASSSKQIAVTIYKDALLGNAVVSTTFYDGDRALKWDLTKTLEKNNRYYIVFSAWASTEGDQNGYEFKLTKADGSEDSGSTSGGSSSSGNSSSGSKSKTTYNGKYYKKIKNSKAFITNMGSKVTVSFKSGKVVLKKKGSDSYLFKKSKARNYIFTRASAIGKKKVSYKLAKGCKIVEGSNFYSNSKITETIKNKSWVKSHFKYGGGGDSIGLCLNKKGQVTMIYVSGFDVYAEQM